MGQPVLKMNLTNVVIYDHTEDFSDVSSVYPEGDILDNNPWMRMWIVFYHLAKKLTYEIGIMCWSNYYVIYIYNISQNSMLLVPSD